ncbi:WD40 repeat domain-containing protein, partial [Roseofilum sp. Guam]|uniref:WD40 repeat domain-containing protein n=1 Tax=Roseofilum sp. Guam TaxID=2821502 RepID=UPI001B1CC019
MIALSPENLDILDNLNWMLEASRGEFALMIACCNYGDLQQGLIDELVKMSALHIKVVKLQEGETSLLNALHREGSYQETSGGNENPIPYSLILTGWERVEQLEKLLASVNQVRESLKGEFPVPMVFWVNQGVLKTLLKSAPDLASWASHYQFRLPSAALNDWLAEQVEHFQRNGGICTPEEAKELAMALEAVQRDMEEEGATLSAEGRAHLELLLGLAGVPYGDNRQIEKAIGHYQRAQEMWEEQGNLEQQGYVCSQLAYAYFRKAFPTRENVQFVPPKLFNELVEEQRREGSEWQVAYGYVQRTLALWEEAGELENVARTFHRWLGILRYLQHWELLAQLACQVIPLHEDEEKWPKRYLLRDYSVLAEVAFEQEQWEEAEQWSEKVLQEAPEDSTQYYMVLSRLILAKVYRRRGERDAAIEQLQRVRESGVERAPRLHVEVLQVLRDLLFERKDYWEAYEVKRELRTAEFEYNFRGFVGASRLKPRPHQRGVATEIRAAGREKAVEELVERILDTSHVVTVIYGYSGVGKSSLLQAGLVPALAEKVHQDRIVPIVLRRYEDWQGQIGEQLREWGIGGEGHGNTETRRHGDGEEREDGERGMGNGWTEADLLRVWREAERSHERIVLIFDQFEEFFFRFRTKPERRALFGLLSEGLERCPKLQVVISIRQDYIHYLFEQRELQRVGDVLGKENAYPLSYFQPEEAVQIIRRLTQKTSFHPEEELLERLVQDLAGETEEVIPIELQIVGSQLEDSYITRLEEYERLYEGVLEPKTELVRRYIETVVQDCGTEHERSAYWLLFLLTDEDLRRPVKTEPELERELRKKIEVADLPLVLKILVGSGLVLSIEERGEQCYQLVHDYLVRYVREQAPELRQLQEKLKEEQTKREEAERSLAEIEKRVRQSRWQLRFTSLASVLIIAGTGGLVYRARVERKLALDSIRWERLGIKVLRQFENVPSQQLETLVFALQITQELYSQVINQSVTEYVAYSPISALQQITQTIRAQNQIPHQSKVRAIAFSPDGRYLATSSDDKTTKITEVENGRTLHTIIH